MSFNENLRTILSHRNRQTVQAIYHSFQNRLMQRQNEEEDMKEDVASQPFRERMKQISTIYETSGLQDLLSEAKKQLNSSYPISTDIYKNWLGQKISSPLQFQDTERKPSQLKGREYWLLWKTLDPHFGYITVNAGFYVGINQTIGAIHSGCYIPHKKWQKNPQLLEEMVLWEIMHPKEVW